MDINKKTSADGKGEEQETRERILRAARQLMAQKGFKGATTRLIAEEAGVNEVTLFRHFGSKEGILRALLDEVTAIRPVLEQSLEEPFENLEEMLIRYGRTFYRLLLERKELVLLCIIEAPNRPELEEWSGRLPVTPICVLTEKLEALHREGKIVSGDFVVAAHIFITSLYSTFIIRNRSADEICPIEEERLIESAAKILVNGLAVS